MGGTLHEENNLYKNTQNKGIKSENRDPALHLHAFDNPSHFDLSEEFFIRLHNIKYKIYYYFLMILGIALLESFIFCILKVSFLFIFFRKL